MSRVPGLRTLLGLLALLSLALPPVHAVVLKAQEQGISDRLVHASGQQRPFLQLDPILCAVARARALDMATRGYFDHVNPDGKAANYLIRQAGYQLPASWPSSYSANNVESIAAGRADAGSTWADWMDSAPHKDHLLANVSFYTAETSYGVGYAMKSGSPYTHYWVVITAPPQPLPKLTVTSPAEGSHLTTPSVSLAGQTSAESTAARVVYRVENAFGVGPFINATGTAAWSAAAVGLAPGVNTFRVRSLSASGATLAEVSRTVVYTIFKPLTVEVSGSGSVTAGFLGSSDRQLNKSYTITAQPADGEIFAGWTGSVAKPGRALTFTMTEGFTLQANFVPNPFLGHTGGFTGLLAGDRPGIVRLLLSESGAFSGRLRYADHSYTLLGKFQPDGTATLSVARPGLSPLLVTLTYAVADGSGVAVSIQDGAQTSTTSAAANFRTGAIFAGAGRYTVVLPSPSNLAAGDGYATLVIGSTGQARLNGALASGTPITAMGTFSPQGVLALFVPLYQGRGELTGNLTLRPTTTSDLQGTLYWNKPVTTTPALEAALPTVGSLYLPPAKGNPVLNLAEGEGNSELTFAGGELEGDVTQLLTIDAENQVTTGGSELEDSKVKLNPLNGRFNGSFIHPVTGKRSGLHGVILQKQNAGFGFFLSTEQSGSVSLAPAE